MLFLDLDLNEPFAGKGGTGNDHGTKHADTKLREENHCRSPSICPSCWNRSTRAPIVRDQLPSRGSRRLSFQALSRLQAHSADLHWYQRSALQRLPREL